MAPGGQPGVYHPASRGMLGCCFWLGTQSRCHCACPGMELGPARGQVLVHRGGKGAPGIGEGWRAGLVPGRCTVLGPALLGEAVLTWF